MFAPDFSDDAGRVRVAVALEPDAASAAEPVETPATVKVTLPEGGLVPDTGVTTAVN